MCQVLLRKGVCNIFTFSLNKDQYFDIIKNDDKVNIFERDIFMLKERIFEEKEKFSFIFADGACSGSYKNNAIFEKELDLIKLNLKLNGGCIIKHNNYFEINFKELKLSFENFEKIWIYKPVCVLSD